MDARFVFLLRLCLACCFLLPFASQVEATTLYVAKDGNDRWSGARARPTADRRDGPLASLTGARERIRRLRAARRLRGPVTVLIAGGTYYLREPFVLESQDSGTRKNPIRYQAAPRARPVFSGGRRVTGWQRGADGVWYTHVPGVKEGSWYFEQLWVNGRRALRAREPNGAFLYMTEVKEELLDKPRLHKPGKEKDYLPQQARHVISVTPESIRILDGVDAQALTDINLLAFNRWSTTRKSLETANPKAGTFSVRGWSISPRTPLTKGTPFFLENFRAALNAPGEWFLDRDGTLYYQPLPGEDMTRARVIAPVTDKLLALRGKPDEGRFVEYVQFNGLAFLHSRWLTPEGGFLPAPSSMWIDAAITADGARHVRFLNCEIGHVGTYAIWFRFGSRDIVLRHCNLHDLGAGGARIGDISIEGVAQNESFRTSGIVVDNNIIRHGGRVFPNAAGVWIGQSGGNRITHNEIADLFYNGINVGATSWGYGNSLAARNLVAYNHIHQIGWGVLSDFAGVHTLGPSPGTVISHNVIHDVYAYDYGGWGLYLDDGSSNITLENNLVYNTMSGGFHHHFGRENVVKNNIFAFGRDAQLRLTTPEPHLSFTFSNNIVYSKEGVLLDGKWRTAQVRMEKNLYYKAAGAPVRFSNDSFEAWQASGRDEGSLVVDPMFVAPERFDFRLKPDSPAARIGFQPFRYAQAGVYGDGAWIRLARRERYPSIESPPSAIAQCRLYIEQSKGFSISPDLRPTLEMSGPCIQDAVH